MRIGAHDWNEILGQSCIRISTVTTQIKGTSKRSVGVIAVIAVDSRDFWALGTWEIIEHNIFFKHLNSGDKDVKSWLHVLVTCLNLSPLIYKMRIIMYPSMSCEDEIRLCIQIFRKALAHRDSVNVYFFTGIHLFINRISGFILYTTSVVQNSEHW